MNDVDFVIYYPSPQNALDVKDQPNGGVSADLWLNRQTEELACLLDLDMTVALVVHHEKIRQFLGRALFTGKFHMARYDGADVAAWAWRSDGMTGWALGHLKPTPENTHKFHERNTEVQPLAFLPYPQEAKAP